MSTSAAEREQLTQILAQTGQGDQRAFAELYKRTSSKLFGVCLRMLRDRGAAEEVLQEIYITVWNRADRFDRSRASPITWLFPLHRLPCLPARRRSCG